MLNVTVRGGIRSNLNRLCPILISPARGIEAVSNSRSIAIELIALDEFARHDEHAGAIGLHLVGVLCDGIRAPSSSGPASVTWTVCVRFNRI